MNAMRFGTPATLLLLVFLPVAAALARRRVTPRGALALRLLVLVLLVTALASPVLSTRGGDLSVVFAVDRSDSIPADRFAAAQEFVRSAAARRRPGDRVGLVTFGATAITEELPNPQPRLAFATQPAAAGTDLGQAIRASLAALPPEGAKRIVLLTDGNDNRGGVADALALPRLRNAQGVRVRRLSPEALPVTAAGMREAAAVMLDDVPAHRLSPAQMIALRDYVGRAGGGLIAVGGPNSYGVGGYAGTPLEEVLPVSMDVRHRLAIPSMAIILVIDTSGSMGAFGTQIAKVELAKETAQSVIDLLGEHDVLGVVAFDQEARWLAVPTEARHRDRVIEQVSRIQAGGGTNMYPAIRLAYEYLRHPAARVRYVIVLSDAQTAPGAFETRLRRMAADKITASAVAIGADADLELMQHVARWGGGRSYATRSEEHTSELQSPDHLVCRLLLEKKKKKKKK